jgi:hypothetical protein
MTKPIVITIGRLTNKDGPMVVHMLPYHQTFGDKKLCLAFFIIPTDDIEFMFGHGSIKKNLYKAFVHLFNGRCLLMKVF